MYKWSGSSGAASLPDRVEKDLRRQIKHVLNRYGFSSTGNIVEELTEEVSFALAGRNHELKENGAGRPPNGIRMLLSSRVADLLENHGIRGNWQTWPGNAGPVAELEAIAQTAFVLACGKSVGALARPARISNARKTLGKIARTNQPVSRFKPIKK